MTDIKQMIMSSRFIHMRNKNRKNSNFDSWSPVHMVTSPRPCPSWQHVSALYAVSWFHLLAFAFFADKKEGGGTEQGKREGGEERERERGGQIYLEQMHNGKHISDYRRKFPVAIASLCFDFCLDESHTDTQRKTCDILPLKQSVKTLLAVDVWGTLQKLDSWQEMKGNTSCYRESSSVTVTPSGKCYHPLSKSSNTHLRDTSTQIILHAATRKQTLQICCVKGPAHAATFAYCNPQYRACNNRRPPCSKPTGLAGGLQGDRENFYPCKKVAVL